MVHEHMVHVSTAFIFTYMLDSFRIRRAGLQAYMPVSCWMERLVFISLVFNNFCQMENIRCFLARLKQTTDIRLFVKLLYQTTNIFKLIQCLKRMATTFIQSMRGTLLLIW